MPAKKKKALKWSIPGLARATIFFQDVDKRDAIHVSLMPNFEKAKAVDAFIGDKDTADDVMKIEHFDDVFISSGKKNYIYPIIINHSDTDVNVKLVFIFAGTKLKSQEFPYTIKKNDFISATIPVEII